LNYARVQWESGFMPTAEVIFDPLKHCMGLI